MKMRESNSSRELADMAMMRELKERIEQLEAKNAALEEEKRVLKEQIVAMQSAQPVTKNFNILHDYVATQYVQGYGRSDK
jgi:cell division protein FtsB